MVENDLNIYKKSRKKILFDNFLGGVAWGVGSLIGATIVVGVLGSLIVYSRNVPFVGGIVDIIKEQVTNGIKEFEIKTTDEQ